MEASKETVRSWVRGSLLGAGSFGQVNLAMNAENGGLFAVKSVECTDKNRAQLMALENELEILQILDSDHVVKCLGGDWSDENGKRMRNVFLEYVPGGSLADLTKKFGGKLEEQLVRSFTRGILQGIEYLHRRGIVHGDIKGKNVLVGLSGVKLADFGAATYLENVSGSEMKGTPLWMAPEVARQECRGSASDIWSVGCTVIEMFTGRAPWDYVDNPFVVLYRIGCSDEIPVIPCSLSAEGQDFLKKCLCREPSDRWTTSQLLAHPFVAQDLPVLCKSSPVIAPGSPTSVLEFDNSWDSSESVPVLSLKGSSKVGILNRKKIGLKKKQSISKGSSSDPEKSHCPSSPSQSDEKWVVVRSPQGKNPVRNLFDRLSDFRFHPSQSIKSEAKKSTDSICWLNSRKNGCEDHRNDLKCKF